MRVTIAWDTSTIWIEKTVTETNNNFTKVFRFVTSAFSSHMQNCFTSSKESGSLINVAKNVCSLNKALTLMQMDGILVLLRVIVVLYSNKIYFYFDI